MMNRFATLALLAAIPAMSLADERAYAFTYEPVVSVQGERELELYETLYQPRQGGSAASSWEHMLEVGYGVTDQLTMSLYGVFRTTATSTYEPAALKLETLYKVFSAGEAPFDLVLYLELEKQVVDDRPWGAEEKVLVGRTDGRFSWALNLVAEQEFPAAGGKELKVGWSAGAAVEPVGGLRLGVESFGTRTRAVDRTTQLTAYAGPTGAVALPFMPRLGVNSGWLIVGASFGLNQASDRVQARAVLGCDF